MPSRVLVGAYCTECWMIAHGFLDRAPAGDGPDPRRRAVLERCTTSSGSCCRSGPVGWNGTSASRPQLEQVAEYIWREEPPDG